MRGIIVCMAQVISGSVIGGGEDHEAAVNPAGLGMSNDKYGDSLQWSLCLRGTNEVRHKPH